MHAQSHSCCREGMPNGQRASPVVPLIQIWIPHLLAQPHVGLAEPIRIHSFEICNDLSSKSLMNLPCVDVIELEIGLLEDLRNAIGRSQEQLINGVLRDVEEISEICLRLESQFLGLCFSRDQTS